VEVWDFLQSPPADAATNMATDEVLLRTAAQRGRPLLRLYSWRKPSVSIGYFQKFPAELADNYEIVRRPTGGGLVYHGKDTTYTVVVPPSHRLFALPVTEGYRLIHQAVGAALESVVGPLTSAGAAGQPMTPREGTRPTTALAGRAYDCFENPVPGDVMARGRKLAGGAQRRAKWGLLHQGSIAAKLTVEQLQDGFRSALGVEFRPYSVSQEERETAERLSREKYITERWNRRVS
jgi:lipoate-protein ligase A